MINMIGYDWSSKFIKRCQRHKGKEPKKKAKSLGPTPKSKIASSNFGLSIADLSSVVS